MNDYLKTKELYHHGTKGQKWGIRRYQNLDGSLTEEGKRRYGSVEGLEAAAKSNKTARDVTKELGNMAGAAQGLTNTQKGSKAIRKDYSNLTDEELQKRVKRLTLERSYGDLSGDTKYVQTGKEKAREWLQTIGSLLAIAGSGIMIINAIRGFSDVKTSEPQEKKEAAKTVAGLIGGKK